MSNVIFLDIDGVLNNRIFGEFNGHCIAALNHIIEEVTPVFVLSSNWRKHWELNELEEYFESKGIKGIRLISATPLLLDARGAEIKFWISAHEKDFEDGLKFCIIDDRDDMEPYMDKLFKTEMAKGLTQEVADKVINYFKS